MSIPRQVRLADEADAESIGKLLHTCNDELGEPTPRARAQSRRQGRRAGQLLLRAGAMREPARNTRYRCTVSRPLLTLGYGSHR